jgi:hypothetical protein
MCFIFLVKFIPKYLIFYIAASEIAFMFSFSENSYWHTEKLLILRREGGTGV